MLRIVATGMARQWQMFSAGMAFLLLGVSGCGQVQFSEFNGAKAFAETEALVQIVPRDAGTAGAHRAAVHLEGRLKSFGLETTIDTFSEKTPVGNVTFHNVQGDLPGKTQRLIILASHFDTKAGISPNFQGANDSGSSSGVVLELARVLSEKGPMKTGFLFAFFDGEECQTEYGPPDGLHGSRGYRRRQPGRYGQHHQQRWIGY